MTEKNICTIVNFQGKTWSLPKLSINITIAILFVGIISCSQKFPVNATDDVGILVIPLEIHDQNPEHTFLYNYILNYTPKTNTEIYIKPSSSKQFEIIDNFKVGKFTPQSLSTIGLSLKKGGKANIRRKEMPLYYSSIPFTIKAGYVNVMPQKLVISKYDTGSNTWRQSWRLISITSEEKDKLINELKKLDNANEWKFE